jgi:hypothetical protein
MTDLHLMHDDSAEPARDARLGALLAEVVGTPQAHTVHWDALAGRIRAAVHAHDSAPWWSYAERWQRRVLPIAMAAGLVGALALAGTVAHLRGETTSSYTSADAISAVTWGDSSDDAARSLARTLTNGADVLSVGVPE